MKIRSKLSKKALFGIFAIVIAGSLIATGAILSYYGKVETTINAQQAVLLDGQDIYGEKITHNLDLTGGCCEVKKHTVYNQGCVDAPIAIDTKITNATSGGWINSDGVNVAEYIIGGTQTIKLRLKNVNWTESPWDVIHNETTGANLTIGRCGKDFDYTIDYYGLPETEYALIYYANYPDYWEEGPVSVIDTFTAGSSGTYHNWNSTTPTMPSTNDENAQRSINVEAGENYTHEYGAKFWLVPTIAVEGDDLNWSMADKFLFETDLGMYQDCDEVPEWQEHVFNEFNQTIIKPGQDYCLLIQYCLDVAIDPLDYKVTTKIVPVTSS